MFKKEPICEKCKSAPVVGFCPSGNLPAELYTNWLYLCEKCAEDYHYQVSIDSFFYSPGGLVDWLAHLNNKWGMNWSNFMGMMNRFKEATGSFG